MATTPIRIGIFGTLRGATYAGIFTRLEGVTVTAICDGSARAREKALAKLPEGVAVFEDFDTFIQSGLFDAVLLCNYFCEHAPFAIRAMEHGVDVLSECTPALTLAECVALCRTVERTGRKYMLAENYPYWACNLEMGRRYAAGKIGRALYCEGEYNHPAQVKDRNKLAPGRLHWRNWIPRTYYITHALAPILAITGERIRAVNCKCVFAPELHRGTACRVGDAAAIILCELESGALARVTGTTAWGGKGSWYRICGEHGSMETIRGDKEQLRVRYNPWTVPEGEEEVATVPARWYDDEALCAMAAETGHGGGDFWVAYHFVRYLRGEAEPMFDVWRAVEMSATAIFALRSAQNSGAEYRIPDFRVEAERAPWADDHASPFPDREGRASIPCCSHPDFAPTEDDYAQAERDWQEAGLI